MLSLHNNYESTFRWRAYWLLIPPRSNYWQDGLNFSLERISSTNEKIVYLARKPIEEDFIRHREDDTTSVKSQS